MYSIGLLKNLFFLEACIFLGYGLFYACLSKKAQRDLGHRPLIIFAGLSAICFLAPGLLAAHALFFLFPLLFVRERVNAGIIAALGLISVPLISTELRIGGTPLIVYSFHNSLILGTLAALAFSKDRLARHPFWTNIPLIIIIILMAIVSARGTTFTNGLRQLTAMILGYGIPVFVITRALKTVDEAKLFLLCLAAAGAMLSVIVIYETRGHWPLYSILDGRYGIIQTGVVAKFRGFFMRAYGPMGEATQMGFVLVICFAAAMVSRRSFQSSVMAICAAILSVIGLIGPQSRGGFVGAAIVLVVTIIYREGSKSFSKLFSAGALLTVALVGGYAYDQIQGGRFSIGMDQAQDTVDYRERLLDRGMEEFYKHPISGASYNDVVARMHDLVQGEGIVDFVNSYLYFALFTGIFGLMLFFGNFLISFYLLLLKWVEIKSNESKVAISAFGASVILAVVVMLAFTSFMDRVATLTVAAMQIGLTGAFGLYLNSATQRKRSFKISEQSSGEMSGIAKAVG